MLLMFQDLPVYDESSNTVLSKNHLPVLLRNRCNVENFNQWLARRASLFCRGQVKLLSNAIGFPQVNEFTTRMWAMRITRALCVEDCYWLKSSKETLQWKDVNPLFNKKINVLVPVLLDRCDRDLKISLDTIEYASGGSAYKAWVLENGAFYLHKSTRYEFEILSSQILDAFGIEHVEYTKSQLCGKPTCKCRNMSDAYYSRIPAADLRDNMNDYKAFIQYVSSNFNEDFRNMCIIDYIICNQDRHAINWGFFMDNSTGYLMRLHPLFDHNWAFGEVAMRHGAASKVFPDWSLEEVAVKLSRNYKLKCVKAKLPKFNNKEQRDYFNKACEKCGVLFI